jgi:hypothetical protein
MLWPVCRGNGRDLSGDFSRGVPKLMLTYLHFGGLGE